AYWTLAAAQREVAVRDESVSLAARQLDETKARIRTGVLPKNEEAQPRAELERRKGELLASRQQAIRADNALKALILDQRHDAPWSSPLTASDTAETVPESVDAAAAVADAVEKRPEIEDARASLTSRSIERQGARDQTRPRLDAYASYARRGLA